MPFSTSLIAISNAPSAFTFITTGLTESCHRIAQARKPSGSQRSSRAGTPTAFGQQQPAQQSMPSFQPPGQGGTGFGGDFNFSMNSGANPFAQTNGAVSTPPPTFGFGDTSNQTQQNGGSIFGNNSTSFGSTFNGASSQQPQQNGFNPSTTSMFGQNMNDSSKGSTSSIFAGFGQNNDSQSQQNGLTPSTNNSFPSFGKQNDNPFKGFGQTPRQTQSTANTSFNSFGQTAQTNGEKTPSTPFVFGQSNTQTQPIASKSLFATTSDAEQTPKTATSNIFSGFGQQNKQNGDKPLFASTSQAEQSTKSTTSNIFGGQPNNALGLFGSTPPPESGTQTPKPGESVFGSLNQSKNNSISADMFTKSRDQTPNPTNSNPFGQPPSQSSADATEQTPKPANIFGQSSQSQANGVKPSLFTNTSTSKPDQSSHPNLFSGNFEQQQMTQSPQQTSAPVFKFGQSAPDTSMTTPGNTPQKAAGASTEQATTAVSSSNAATTQSGGLFGSTKSSEDAPATAQKPLFQPSTSLFNPPPSATPAASNAIQQTPAAQGTSMFDKIAPSDAPATAFNPSFTPSTSLANKPADKTAAPWLSHAPAPSTEPTLQQPTATVASARPVIAAANVVEIIPDAEKKSLKVLNEGFRKHLARQDANADWTPVMKYYMQQAAKIRKKPEPKFNAGTAVAQNSVASSDASRKIQQTLAQQPASTAPPATSMLFSSATPKTSAPTFQQTPRPSGTTSLLQPPQTAPVNKKRAAEEDVSQQPPATEKRARSNEPTEYPKLPDNASETAKLFQAALDKSSSNASSMFKSAAEAKEKEAQEKAERERKEKEAKEKADKEKETAVPKFGGFKPSTSGSTPSASSGMPSFSAPSNGNGFMAAFGKKANEQEEKERKKRKMDDYDSDEETEEAWAERDKIEQAAKRQRILDAAKSGSGFTPSGSAATTPAPESDIGEGSEKGSERGDDTDTEAPVGRGKSLFDRITPRESPAPGASKPSLFSAQTSDPSRASANLFAPKTPSGLGTNSMTTSNNFSQFSKPRESIEITDYDKAEAEKEQGTGDHTWKPNTPIKFGGSTSTAAESTTPAAPPPFSNLFGNLQKSNTDSNGNLSVPKPTFGFNFGGQPPSVATSRASTPGFTTDGEGASTAGEEAEEEDHAPAEPQVEDQTGLRDSEKANEDLLFSVHMAKAMKWGEKKNDSGEIVWGWVDKGKGPVYILKHKETGKVRIVLKVPPYGTPRMNFEPLKNVEYEVPKGGSGKMVQGIFVDHLDEKVKGEGKVGLSKWLIQVGKKEDAESMAKTLMENRAK